MHRKKCCFAGHNESYCDSIKNQIKEKIIELIEKEHITIFNLSTI